MDNKLKLIKLLKKIKEDKLKEIIKIRDINNNEDLIIKGILFDNESICYHDYKKIEDVVTGLMVSADNYGIYYNDEFIGIISVYYQYYKDLTRLELSICINKDYRSIGVGSICYEFIIDNYFKKDNVKSIHLSIREDNVKSRFLAEKYEFKIYTGYKCDNYFNDINGNTFSQVQYLLKKKDYKKY